MLDLSCLLVQALVLLRLFSPKNRVQLCRDALSHLVLGLIVERKRVILRENLVSGLYRLNTPTEQQISLVVARDCRLQGSAVLLDIWQITVARSQVVHRFHGV